MKQWRPDDWGEIKKDELLLVSEDFYWIFEAGADMILQALKKNALNYVQRGKYEIACDDGFITGEHEQTGWVVFIPEEE